ncbi:MAG: hypothetical protein M1812_007108 [Candelaria pacifica]|nr:MAG: hypothetical protein M1812_007108 [Candelaria pacifica]
MERLPQDREADDNNLDSSNYARDLDLAVEPFHPPNPSNLLLSSNEEERRLTISKGDNGSTASSDTTRLEKRAIIEKFGYFGIIILLAGTVVIAAALGFLSFLWFADYSNKTWQLIIVRQWATRAVSLSALAIRTAISFQSGLATAMLAALVLERFGVLLEDSARISTLRATTPHPFRLAHPLILGWRKNMSAITIPAVTTLLFITTVLLQFTSTVLLADLKQGSVPSLVEGTTTAHNFRYSPIDAGSWEDSGRYKHHISRPSTWTRKPPFYPVFAEYSEPPFVQDGVKDTGLTLRAFLPIQSAQGRENIRNYTGKAPVLDARVTCQRPALVNESVYYSNGMISFAGQIFASTPTPRLDKSTSQKGATYKDKGYFYTYGSHFGCVAPVASAETIERSDFTSWQTSICQLEERETQAEETPGNIAGGLVSEFFELRPNRTHYLPNPDGDSGWSHFNAAYLVLNVTSGASDEWHDVMYRRPWSRPPFYSEHDEWVDYIWSKKGLVISATLCYTSYDTADLDVRIYSSRNRTEPTTGYNMSSSSYTFGDIRRQLGQAERGTSLEDRGLLTLEKKSSWLSDFERNHTSYFQSWLQSDGDMVGRNSSSGMIGNISAALWRSSSESDLRKPSGLDTADTIITDGMYTTLFQEIIVAGGSVAFAIQSLITVFSGLAYYDQLPQFDLEGKAEQISFIYIITPQSHRGFTAMVVVLLIHLIIVLFVTLWFALESKYTLLGNSWLGVAQVVSSETDDTIAKVTTTTDRRVGRMLKSEDRDGRTVGIGRVDENGRVAIVRRVNKF